MTTNSTPSRPPHRAGAAGILRAASAVPLVVAALATIPLGAGCGGDAEGREAVSGTVTMNGAPLTDATIEFTPLSQDAKSFAGATIIEGEYSIPAKRGLQPGEYKVVISMAGSTPEVDLNEPPGDSSLIPPAPELIPAKYSSESQLTAKVEASGDNRFDFELTK